MGDYTIPCTFPDCNKTISNKSEAVAHKQFKAHILGHQTALATVQQQQQQPARLFNNDNYESSAKKSKANKRSEMEKALYYFSDNLWKTHIEAYELTQIMRTNNKEFAEIQHRLRDLRHERNKNNEKTKKLEPMMPQDVEYLNSNCKAEISDPDYDFLALHIFYKNDQVDQQNKKAIEILQNEGQTMELIIAKDSFVDSTFINDGSKARILLGLKQKDSKITGQLRYELRISKKCRISLTTNINVKDGLVNGAMGTVQYFTKTNTGHIHIIWIEFDDKDVGTDLRANNKGLYYNNKQIKLTWTPIMAIYKQFQTGAIGKRNHYLISRIQFPLEIAFARTLTKIQGMSLDFKHYVDFKDIRNKGTTSKPVYVQHNVSNAYVVGLTRATDPSNLKIINGFKESQIGRSATADNEIDRLRNDPLAKIIFKVPDLREMTGTKIVFYNLQGLQSGTKIENLAKDSNLVEADFIFGAETNLNNESSPEQYNIHGFESKPLIRYKEKLGRGLIMYSKQSINHDHLNKIMREDVEFGKYQTMIEGQRMVILFVYRSEQYSIRLFRNDLHQLVDEHSHDKNVLIIGDMNSEEHLIESNEYQQIILSPTTSGVNGKRIDQAYIKSADFTATGHVLYKL